MKHTTEELLLALQVQALATAIRNASIPESLEGEDMRRWKRENPSTGPEFVKTAMERIVATADQIKALA